MTVAVQEVDAALAAGTTGLVEAPLNVGQVRICGSSGVAPGSTREVPGRTVTRAPNVSLAVNRSRTRAPAELKVLCPDTYSGKGGVMNVAGWKGR